MHHTCREMETRCTPDPSGVEMRVQPLSLGFLCSDRIRMFLPCRLNNRRVSPSKHFLTLHLNVLHALFIFLQQAPRGRQLSVQFMFQSSYPPAACGGMLRIDMVHGTNGPRFQAGESLFARVAAVLETPTYPASSKEG